jgi:hypothetical protein
VDELGHYLIDMDGVLVHEEHPLSGVTTRGDLDRFPYVPDQVVSGVGDLVVGRRDTDDRSSRLRTAVPQPDER